MISVDVNSGGKFLEEKLTKGDAIITNLAKDSAPSIYILYRMLYGSCQAVDFRSIPIFHSSQNWQEIISIYMQPLLDAQIVSKVREGDHFNPEYRFSKQIRKNLDYYRELIPRLLEELAEGKKLIVPLELLDKEPVESTPASKAVKESSKPKKPVDSSGLIYQYLNKELRKSNITENFYSIINQSELSPSKILQTLIESGKPLCCKDLVTITDLAQPTISNWTVVLEYFGLIRQVKPLREDVNSRGRKPKFFEASPEVADHAKYHQELAARTGIERILVEPAELPENFSRPKIKRPYNRTVFSQEQIRTQLEQVNDNAKDILYLVLESPACCITDLVLKTDLTRVGVYGILRRLEEKNLVRVSGLRGATTLWEPTKKVTYQRADFIKELDQEN